MWGTNLSFNKAYFANKVTIKGSISYDTLYLEEGQGMLITDGTVQTINQIVINHDKCLSTEIASTNGSTATIRKTSGILSLDYITLRHVAATGGAIFNAMNCDNQGGNTGWNITALTATTYYWVGGTGSWLDKKHWSASSGGPPASCVPNSASHVIFDENSFTAPMQTVNLTISQVSCGSMLWKNLSSPAVLNGSILTVGGNLTLDSSLIFQIDILNLSPAIFSSVTTAGVLMPWVNLEGNGSYSFEDDFYSKGYLIVNAADTIHFNHKNFNISDLYFRNSTPLVIDLDSATFHVAQLGMYGVPVTTISQGADIFCKDNVSVSAIAGWNFPFNTLHASCDYLDARYAHFNRIILEQYSTIRAGFLDCEVDEFTCTADKTILGGINSHITNADLSSTETLITLDFTIGHLKIEPGKTLKITAGKTLFVENEIEASGNSGFPIYFLSSIPGTKANISKPSGTTCFDYLYISDMNVTGGATFIAGAHSANISNNTGWDFTSSCIPLTASYEYPVCEGDMIKLHATDIGAGPYQWMGPAGFTSFIKDPVINNAGSWNSGIYQVTSGSKTSIIYVTVHKLPLKKIVLLSANTIASMDINANVNQWYKDGVLLSETGKYCGNYGPGKYFVVLTSPEGCRINSDTLIIYDYSYFIVPATPLYLNAWTISASEINLSWQDNSSNETGFVLERSLSPTWGFTVIDTVLANTTNYSDSGLNSNTTYYYRAVAINLIGPSSYSNTTDAATLEGSPTLAVPGANNPANDYLFMVYPNPVKGFTKIYLDKVYDTDISIYNSYGQYILTTQIKDHIVDIGKAAVVPGLYILQFNFKGRMGTAKMVVE
jgi:hypothetical protein